MSALGDRIDPDALARSIGVTRVLVGAGLFLAPTTAVRMLGVDSGTAKRMTFLARMTAARDVALGVGTVASVGTPQAPLWLTVSAASDAVDALAIAGATRRGVTHGIGAAAAALSGVVAAAAGGWAVAELRRRS